MKYRYTYNIMKYYVVSNFGCKFWWSAATEGKSSAQQLRTAEGSFT